MFNYVPVRHTMKQVNFRTLGENLNRKKYCAALTLLRVIYNSDDCDLTYQAMLRKVKSKIDINCEVLKTLDLDNL